MKLKRNNKIQKICSLLILSFIFFSCEDVFHNANTILEEINQENTDQTNNPPPKRIFIGGNFKYSEFDANTYKEAFAVIDGNGTLLEDFFDPNANGLYGDGTGWKGVRTIELTDDSIYVAGEFQGYVFDHSAGPPPNSDHQMLQRYSIDGVFDPAYTPASAAVNASVFALKPLDDGTLIVGGNFTSWFNSYLTRINNDGTQNLSIPLITNGFEVKTFFTPDSTTVFMGGQFSEITPYNTPGAFQNFAVFTSAVVMDPSTIFNPPINTTIGDIEMSEDGFLYIGGAETAMMKLAFGKYIYNGSGFDPDTEYNTTFINEMARSTMSQNAINAIASDSQGRVYLGGDFMEVEDMNGGRHSNILRLTPSGFIDPTFRLDFGSTGIINAIEIQKDGNILIGGSFWEDTFGYGIIRFFPNGEMDYSFDRFAVSSNMNVTVYAIAIEEEADPVP